MHCMSLSHKVFQALALTQSYRFWFHKTNLYAADRAGDNTSSTSSYLEATATPNVNADSAC